MPKLIVKPTQIQSAGNKPKIIEEYVGRINSNTVGVSIAHMRSPAGWIEPGQTPDFDEYTYVLKGVLTVDSKDSCLKVVSGQAVFVQKGEWVQYSTLDEEGAEYLAVCIPAFSPNIVHRDV